MKLSVENFTRFRGLKIAYLNVSILVPRGCTPFGQHHELRTLARSNSGSPRFMDFPTLRMLRVKSDKSDWFWSQSIVFTNPFKTEMSLDLARGCDSWCWPKGAWPLGTRIKCEKFNTEIGFFKNTFGEEAFWCVHCIRNLAQTVYFGQQNTPSWLLLHTIWWIRKSWQWMYDLCSWWVSLSPKANSLVKNFMNLIKLLLQSKLS